jgi:hypothetical protein
MVIITVEPAGILVILNEKKPWGKMKLERVPHEVVIAAVRPVIEPLLIVKVAVPVPVAVVTCWLEVTLLVTAWSVKLSSTPPSAASTVPLV